MDHLVQVLHSFETPQCTRPLSCPVVELCQLLEQNLHQKGALARPGHSRDTDQPPEGERHVDLFQVVLGRSADGQRLSVP